MTTRRDFLQRTTTVLAWTAAGLTPFVFAKPPQSLRDIETVRAGEELSVGVHRVFLDGRQCDNAKAFNVAEGWVDVVTYPARRNFVEILRHFGKITYTMEPV